MSAVTSVAEKWVEEAAGLTRPSRVVWSDGSKAEYDALIEAMLRDGTLLALNPRSYPNCYLHRSHPSDVARTEQLTFICSREKGGAGPTNNWIAPSEAKSKAGALFRGSMRGRTMYALPYLMGPAGSPMSRVGLMVTDSAYVVASMHIMTRVGRTAIQHMRGDGDFVAGLHSLGDLAPDRRLILHLPEETLIWSVGSGYGGNALLGKKCHALRIASSQARREGWLAEHMLIIGVEDPEGRVTYLAGAMPSASGKTNLAMVVSHLPGWRAWTLGDDIAWMWVDAQGQLRAINPERGFFGVAPNTSPTTNPNGATMVRANTIFTNVALTPAGEPWWEGLTGEAPAGLCDWQGKPREPRGGPPAHPNSRFTPLCPPCPPVPPPWEDPPGRPRRPSELALHRALPAVPVDRAQLGRSAGRAHLRAHLRLAALERDPARLRELRLDPRRLPRLGDVHGDDGGDHGQGRRGAPRPDGDAAVLRLQHGRLLRPLARDGGEAGHAAAPPPRELGSPRRRRPLPLARVLREHARA